MDNEHCEATFYVTDTSGPAIFGLPLTQTLKIIHVNTDTATTTHPPPLDCKANVLKEYPECFNGIGRLPCTYHITVDPAVTPVVSSPRRVPIALKDEIKAELDDTVQQAIIMKVNEGQPTDWVNSIVYQPKPSGKLRICLDPRDLIKAIKREDHVTTTLDEITPKLNGARYLTQDAATGMLSLMKNQAF